MTRTIQSFACDEVAKTARLLDAILGDPGLIAQLEREASLCVDPNRRSNNILFAGSAGSAADAQDLAAAREQRIATSGLTGATGSDRR